MVNIIGKKRHSEFGLFRKSLGCQVVANPPWRDFSQFDPSPPGHPFETSVGNSQGDPKLIG